MKNRYYTLIFLTVVLSCLFGHTLKSGNISGGAIEWECAGEDSFKVNLTLYEDCSQGGSISDTLSLDAQPEGACDAFSFEVHRQQSRQIEGTPQHAAICNNQCHACESACNFDYGLKVHEYTGYLDHSDLDQSCCVVEVSLEECCRSDSLDNIQNPGNTAFRTEARVNHCVDSCPDFPEYQYDPMNILCEGQTVDLEQGAVNGAYNLQYELVNPMDSGGDSVSWVSGYDAETPIEVPLIGPGPPHSAPLGFNLNGSDLHFHPGSSMEGITTLQTQQKTNDTLISETRRDLHMAVVDCDQNNRPERLSPNYVQACSGEELNLSLDYADPDSQGTNPDSVFITEIGGIPEATLIPDSGQVNASATFTWQPEEEDARLQPYNFDYWVRDNGCPIIQRREETLQINVDPVLDFHFSTEGVSCGEVNFSIDSSEILNGTYVWEGPGGLSDTGESVTHKYPEGGKYPFTVKEVSAHECTPIYSDTVEIPEFLTVDAPNDTTLCQGDSMKLKDFKVQHQDGPEDLEAFSVNGVAFNDSIKVTPESDTTLIIEAEDMSGCKNWDTTRIEYRDFPDTSLTHQTLCHDEGLPEIQGFGTDAHDWVWLDNQNNTLSTDTNFTPPDTGSYNFRLYDTTYNTCFADYNFEVSQIPPAEQSLSDTAVCKEETLQVSPISGGDKYQWNDAESGQVLGTDSVLTETVQDTFTLAHQVIRQVGDKECVYHDTMEVFGLRLPGPETLNVPDTHCLNDEPIILPESDHYNVQWTGPGVENDTLWNPSEAGLGHHELQYTLKDRTHGCTAQYESSVFVQSAPEEAFSSPAPQCRDADPVDLPTSEDYPTSWQGPGVDEEENQWHPAEADTGLNTLSYTLTDPETGCTNTNTVVAEVIHLSDEAMTLPDSVCRNAEKLTLPESSEYEISWAGPGIENESHWNPRGGKIGENKLDYVLQDPETGCTTPDSLMIEVLPLPELSLSASPLTGEEPLSVNLEGSIEGEGSDPVWQILNEEGEEVLSYEWWAGEHRFTEEGEYDLSFSATSAETGCRDTLLENEYITVTPGTQLQIRSEEELTVYPNPAREAMIIHAARPIEQITLYTIGGRKVDEHHPGSTIYTLERGNMAEGAYLMEIKLSGIEQIQREQVIWGME